MTWFVPDVLAAAGLDAGNETLFLAPTLRSTDAHVILPLFFPQFWATVEVTRADISGVGSPGTVREPFGTGGRITLKVVKNYGRAVSISRVRAQPIGVAAANGTVLTLPAPFRCQAGAALDLSAHWDELVRSSIIRDRVLPPHPPTSIHDV